MWLLMGALTLHCPPAFTVLNHALCYAILNHAWNEGLTFPPLHWPAPSPQLFSFVSINDLQINLGEILRIDSVFKGANKYDFRMCRPR